MDLGKLNWSALQSASELPGPRSEWLKQRLGRFTASNFGKIMAGGKTAQTYIARVAAESLADIADDHFMSRPMQWGVDHEAEAIQRFSELYGFSPYMTGSAQELIVSECGNYSGTPDGLIGDDCGIEIKCPNPETHLSYFQISDASTLKSIRPEYYWQCYGYMLLTGRSNWYFASYDPRYYDSELQFHAVLISADETELALLKAKIADAVIERDRLLSFAHRKRAA